MKDKTNLKEMFIMLKQFTEVRKIKNENKKLVSKIAKIDNELKIYEGFKAQGSVDKRVDAKIETLNNIKGILREKLVANNKTLDSRYIIQKGA